MALEGSLQDMSLPDLFEIARAGSKSGWLTLTRDDERGVVAVSQGQIADAVLVHGSDRQLLAVDEEALIQLFGWTDALFALEHDAGLVGRPLRVAASPEQLQDEAERRQRRQTTQDLGMASRLALGPLSADAERSLELKLDEWRLLAAFARNLALGEACLEAGLAVERAFDLAQGLLRRGLVVLPGADGSQLAAARPVLANGHGLINRPLAVPAIAAPAPRKPAPAATVAPNRALLSAIMRRVRTL